MKILKYFVITMIFLSTCAIADGTSTLAGIMAYSSAEQANSSLKELKNQTFVRGLTCLFGRAIFWDSTNREEKIKRIINIISACKSNFEIIFPEYKVGDIIGVNTIGDGYVVFEIVKK